MSFFTIIPDQQLLPLAAIMRDVAHYLRIC
jgi:hypothetical protein